MVESAGVNLFPGFAGTDILEEDKNVVGVRTGDKGIDAAKERKGNFEPGIDLRAYDEPRLQVERARIRSELQCKDETVLVGFVGRLAPQKDPGTILEVASRLQPLCPRLRWLMVGGGPLESELH